MCEGEMMINILVSLFLSFLKLEDFGRELSLSMRQTKMSARQRLIDYLMLNIHSWEEFGRSFPHQPNAFSRPITKSRTLVNELAQETDEQFVARHFVPQ